MNDLGQFTQNLDDAKPMGLVPVGTYTALIARGEVKANNAATGHNLILDYEILSGEYKGRTIREWLCIDHPTAKTKEGALYKLKQLAKAIDPTKPSSGIQINDLLNKIVDISVKVNPAVGSYSENNSINKYAHTATNTPSGGSGIVIEDDNPFGS